MDEKLYKAVRGLSEKEAKFLLLSILDRLGNGRAMNAAPAETLDELNAVLDGLQRSIEEQPSVYEAVHLVSGEATAGSLRVGLGRKHKIIGCPYFFAAGPIWRLHEEEGKKRRLKWMEDHISEEMRPLEDGYERRGAAEIASLPEDVPIVVWAGENADEQAGLRYLLYLLKEKSNPIRLINSTAACRDFFNTDETEYSFAHTAEAAPEQLKQVFEQSRAHLLTAEERGQFEREWLELSEQEEVLRVWKDGLVIGVPENHFDHLLLDEAKVPDGGFVKAARVIGGVLGRTEDVVGDMFLEYRLRSLVSKGLLEIKGDPKAMRFYSVKIADQMFD